MPTPITIDPAALPYEPTPKRLKITREQCQYLVDNGLLVGRYELIDGEVIDKMGQNPPHAFVLSLVNRYLVEVLGIDYVRCQLTADVDESDVLHNEPEPDVLGLNVPITQFFHRHPGPGDVRIIVEIADSSVSFDLGKKARLYARSRYPEYWVVDIPGRRVVVHRIPHNGVYESIGEYRETERLALQGHEEHPILVADLLSPAT